MIVDATFFSGSIYCYKSVLPVEQTSNLNSC